MQLPTYPGVGPYWRAALIRLSLSFIKFPFLSFIDASSKGKRFGFGIPPPKNTISGDADARRLAENFKTNDKHLAKF